jgi:hypothetical protein
MKKIILFLWFVGGAILFLGAAPCRFLSGKVRCEGKAVEKVVVTDGFACVQTDENGYYTIPFHDESRFIYLSTPSGYLPETVQGTIPVFYKKIEATADTYNFELTRNPKDDTKHVFIAQADVQMATEEDLEAYKQFLPDYLKFIQEHAHQELFAVDCGDLTGDNPPLVSAYLRAAAVLPLPTYRAIGNHDMKYDGRSHETSYVYFEQNFGPVYYSFNKGNAHYMVIDNTFYVGRDYFYMGYADEKTLQWMAQDLSFVPPGAPVFLMMHIPSRLNAEATPFKYNSDNISEQTVNAKALHQLLSPYNAHIITGHMHYNRNLVFNETLFEHITAAVCGMWWQSDMCMDGTPQGFAVYEIDGDRISWYYKSFNHPKEYQFRAYPPGVYKEYPKDIIVNVWNWDPAWKVEWFENGRNKGEMTRFTGVDAAVVETCARPLKYSWIAPQKMNHLFKATPENPAANIRIRVTDRFGNIYEEALTN